MTIEQNSHNILLLNNLYNLLDSKIKFKKYVDEITFRIPDYTGSLINDISIINSLTIKYKDQLFPILKINASYFIVLYKEKYIKFHDDVCFEEFDIECIYNTVEEVWEKAIKPEIEFCFGIKIEEYN